MIITMDRLQREYGVRPRGILHIGAHLAEEAPAYAAAGVPYVLWVEGNPRLMARLEANLRGFPGQQAIRAVISDKDDEERFLHLATFSMSSSLLPMKRHLEIYPHIVTEHEELVKTVTVDTLLQRQGIVPATFDMLNIDIEGAEMLAFQGMSGLLPYLKWVYIEVNIEEMYEGCPLLPQVDAFLGEQGFTRVAYEDMGSQWGWGDACYQRT